MSQKGLVYYSSHWACDITKIRQKLTEIKVTLSRIKVNPLIKDELIRDIDTTIRLLNKGKVRSETSPE